jgi:hypothetical protein
MKTKNAWIDNAPLMLAVLSALYCIGVFNPHVHPLIRAAPYKPPAGCLLRRYESTDEIPFECANPKYAFDEWPWYGLRSPGSSGWHKGRWYGGYYRVGADLVGIQCGPDSCYVNGTERGVFVHR